MIINTTHIKNLAIALEALSRVNKKGSGSLYHRVEDLLSDELQKQETRHSKAELDLSEEIPF